MQGYGKCRMKTTRYRKFLLIFFFAISIFRISHDVYQKSSSLFGEGYKDKFYSYKKLYYGSQYGTKDNPGIIPDNALELFAAGFLLYGGNPILIIHDQPPLGRYLLALSIAVFNNPNSIMVILIYISLLGTFLIGVETMGNKFLSLVPVALFANEPLFLEKLKYIPLLEPIQFPFIIFSLYFFIRGVNNKNSSMCFLLTALMLGFVISIRFFVLGAVLTFCMFLFLILQKNLKKIILLGSLLPLSLLVLIVSYTRTILDGHSILGVFGIQKYIYWYHKSQLDLPFSFWDLLLFNRWHTWWGDRSISSDYQWNILWPVFTVFSFLLFLFSILKVYKLNNAEKIVLLWCVVYSGLLSLGHTSTRYFLPLIPFLYIAGTSFVIKVFNKYYKTYV